MKDLKAAVKTILILALLATFGYVCWIGGMMMMHERLTDDMKRYNDAPICAFSSTGIFYLYSQDTTFTQWLKTSKEQ